VHIPFCAAKCDYCDFYSIPPGELTIDRYLESLHAQTRRLVESAGQSACIIPSVYIGGGTPSMLTGDEITRVLSIIKSCEESCAPGAGEAREVTVEANENAGEAFLESCRRAGVTRLSLGVQSFDTQCREGAGRRTRLDGVFRAARFWIESAGKLSLDLMTGLPSQTEDTVKRDIAGALSLGATHISLYALTVEPGTLALRNAPPAEAAEKMWLAGRDELAACGFDQYEISNFAAGPHDRCLHNIRYWRMENWLGAGPSASGTLFDDENGTALRLRYSSSLEEFLSLAPPEREEIDAATLMKESIMMGYRYKEGPDKALFQKRFKRSIDELIPAALKKWKNNDERFTFLNRFLLDAFTELDQRTNSQARLRIED
jgi:oxygen-independent coproporphyrinogen-3 oxidase